ncbi:MAG: hypothetical protein ACKOUM_03190 [Sphingopyxis sp.]
MKFLKNVAVAAAALSMVAAPVAASAAPAAQFDGLRASTELQGESAMGEAGGSWVLMLLAGVAVVAGIVIAADGGNDSPTSP